MGGSYCLFEYAGMSKRHALTQKGFPAPDLYFASDVSGGSVSAEHEFSDRKQQRLDTQQHRMHEADGIDRV